MSYPTHPDALQAPLYGASPGQSVARFFKKYATFRGRASRSEYWWVALLSVLVSAVFSVIGLLVSGGGLAEWAESSTDVGDILNYVFALVTLVPSLAISWRRLHDVNRSGLWTLIVLVPLVGWIVLLVFYIAGPDPAGARFDR